MYIRLSSIFLAALLSSFSALAHAVPAQQTPPPAGAPARRPARSGGSISGTVKDNTGGIIPGASVTLSNEGGTVRTVTTGADGSYVFRGIGAGVYTISATYSGLQQEGITAVTVAAGQAATRDISMTLQAQRQEVTVNETATNTVNTDPANNASALVLKQEDLDALPDDPDDLEADLQALAGPSAGPGGNQIYIDGFSGGRLPPKESIREIRINSNPFSAEYDRLGYGRIQIFTKPGSDKFHGQGYYNISDGIWNSRNPFLVQPGLSNPPFRTQLFGGNVSGPLGKHASFFIDTERRQIDDNGIYTSTVPTSDFLGEQAYQGYYSTPQRRTTVSPRADFQLGTNNTLSFRYSFLENDRLLAGIGGFDLPSTTIGGVSFASTGYSTSTTEHTVQIVETAVLSPKAVNETHFIFEDTNSSQTSSSTTPSLNVGQSFVLGGSGYSAPGYPHTNTLEHYYELQNYTSVTWGAHTTKFGARIRATTIDDTSPKNFNGVYSFLGTDTISSIQEYLTTVQLLNKGLSPLAIANLGYGPSKYTVNAGNPYIGLNQEDYGPFVQDDWKARPNLTFSMGLRWESQTNINDHSSWAPRFGFAWSPDQGKGANGRAKTVVRGGWGIFYDRFSVLNVENAYRYLPGVGGYQTYTLNNPFTVMTSADASFSTPIPLSSLPAATSNAAQRFQIDSALQAPRLMQTVIGVERQLMPRTTLTFNFMNSRGVHELRTVNINAPYAAPGLLPPRILFGNNTNGGVRPYGDVGDIYDYQSTGAFKQTQLIVGLNATLGKRVSVFSRYSYTNAHSDTDGIGTLPAVPNNFAADWGRSNLDIAHNLFLGGSVSAPWGLRFSPFVVAHSGTPFNITTGTDLFLQGSNTPTARPGVNNPSLSYYGVPGFPGLTPTELEGFLNPSPLVPAIGTLGDLIGRNAGTGPGFIGLNLRMSKTWGFGTTKFSGPSGGARSGGGGFGGGGGRHGGGFGGPGGGPGGFGGESSEHRYNLTLSINARNILNHENLNTPNGALTSPYFLESTGITGGFGAEATASNQRRIDLRLQFSF